MRQVDDDNDNEEGGNELAFYDDPTLNWTTVYETSGVGEPIIYSRRLSSGGGIVIGSSHASKKGPGATSSPTRRDKEKIQIGVENKLHDSSDSEFEKLLNFEKSFTEGEEEEGCAPLHNIEDNYVGIE